MSDSPARFSPNAIAHFDIAGPDEAVLQRFYHSVFGWTIDAQGPGYALVRTPDGSPDGAVVESEEASLTVGVTVADVAEAVTAAASAGGRIIMPVTDNGWVVKAQVQDPAGNRVTLIQA